MTVSYILFLIILSAVSPAREKFSYYTLLNSYTIYSRLHNLSKKYPDFISLNNAQNAFGLRAVGSTSDCPFDHEDSKDKGCYNWFVTVYDHVTHPVGSKSYQTLPEVIFSGALHGNERVGPTVVMEVLELLVENAYCEALPGMKLPVNYSVKEGQKWNKNVQRARSCRLELKDKFGVGDEDRKWLARLVSTRRLVMVPIANALGYYHNNRTEGNIDPNRDFPFDLKRNPSPNCMRSITARAINELYRQHLFQLGIAFHAGREGITYEWGATSYGNTPTSPDILVYKQLIHAYSYFAGEMPYFHVPAYNTDTINEEMFPDSGGMEDWSYAGSWDSDHIVKCIPEVNGRYDESRSEYNNSTLRSLTMLVETSYENTSSQELLGSRYHIVHRNNDDNERENTHNSGHVARNIRLCLATIDLVEPYLSIQSVGNQFLTDDIVPLSFIHEKQKSSPLLPCQLTKTISIPYPSTNNTSISLTWVVGGGLTVNYTTLIHTQWKNIPKNATICHTHFTEEQMEAIDFFHIEEGITHGLTRWSPNTSGNKTISGPLFNMSIDISNYSSGDHVAVYAMAIVDQDWASQPNNNSTTTSITSVVHPKQSLSMSHVVNARTNPHWSHKSAGKIIQGRKRWFSLPLTLVIGNNYDSVVELSDRMVEVNIPTLTTINSNNESSTIILNTNNNTESHDAMEWKKHKHIIHSSTLTIALIVSLSIIILFHFRWKIINNVTIWNQKRRERMFYQHYCQKYPYHNFGLELEAEDGDENMDLSVFGINIRNHIENDESVELS